jgi:hypothetical protein
MLGVIMGVVFTGSAVFSDNSGYDESYVITFATYLIVAAIVFATVTGLLVGMLNGTVLTVMSRAGAFRSAAGISANRVTCCSGADDRPQRTWSHVSGELVVVPHRSPRRCRRDSGCAAEPVVATCAVGRIAGIGGHTT